MGTAHDRLVVALAAAGILLAVGSGRAQPAHEDAATLKTPTAITIQDTPTGLVFADGEGYTLYVTERDTEPDVSTCVGPCATEWPPVRAAAESRAFGDWTLVPRTDGTPQWAYRGRPLYRYRHEARPRWAEAHSRVWYIATVDPFPVVGGRLRYGRYSLVTKEQFDAIDAPGGIVGRQTPSGPVYADWEGRTLYTRRRGLCDGPCLETWRPFVAPMAAVAHGEWTLVEGPGNARLWAYDGQALYRCVHDRAPGETTCEGTDDGGQALRFPPELAR